MLTGNLGPQTGSDRAQTGSINELLAEVALSCEGPTLASPSREGYRERMMKRLVCLGLLLGLISFDGVYAQAVGPSCPELSIAGIDSQPALREFLKALQSAAVAKDKDALAHDALYPLRVNSKRKAMTIKTRAELKSKFDLIFSHKVLRAIALQKFHDLFCRDQGVMIGDGEVWIGARDGKIGIVSINL